MNAVRVYLHDLAWRTDQDGFLRRVDSFLDAADRHGIRSMLVLFDGVWDPFPRAGAQDEPRPRVHNSRWVQSPGAEILSDPSRHDELEAYVTAVVGRFRDDPRVVLWDVMNEPDNPNPAYAKHEPAEKPALALALLEKAYGWTRAAGASQPLTSAVWRNSWKDPDALSPIDRFLLHESDVVSFHAYVPAERVRAWLDDLAQYGRPVLCSEFLARPFRNDFGEILPIFAERRVGAFCWGLVAGRTQTIYPWDSWMKEYASEPDPWFHDVLRPDGTPYRDDEVELLRRLSGR